MRADGPQSLRGGRDRVLAPQSGRSGISAGAATAAGALLGELVDLIADATASRLTPLIEALAERRPAPLLDRRGLAQALACCVDVVDRLRAEGCPRLRIGDVDRFDLEQVLGWLREREP